MTARRYDLASLLEATGLSEAALGRLVGLSGSTLKNARERGLTMEAADRYAVRAGLHPFEVWVSMPGDRKRDQWNAAGRRRWASDPAHRAARAEYMRRYRAEAARSINVQKRRWADANREKVRAMNREATRRWRERKRQETAA